MRKTLTALWLLASVGCAAEFGVAGTVPTVPAPSSAASAPSPAPAAAPTAVVTGQSDPWGIAADDAHVYWTNWKGGTIWSASTDASASPKVVIGGVHPENLRVDAQSIYWVDTDPHRGVDDDTKQGAVMKIDKAGAGKPVVLVSGLGSPSALAVDATHVYFADELRGTVSSVPIGGGAVTVLAQNLAELAALDADADYVYFIYGGEGQGPGTLARVAKTGGAPQPLVSGNARNTMAVGPTGVYFRRNDDVWRCDPDGKNAAKIDTGTGLEPRAFAAGAQSMIVLGRHGFDSDAEWMVAELPGGGGAARVLADHLPSTDWGEIAANAAGAYTTDDKHGTVTKIPR